MRKILSSTLLTLFTVVVLQAQVQIMFSKLSDQETYLVSLMPEQTIAAPFNMSSNIQIVIKVPLDQTFMAGEIESLVPGLEWVDNAIIDQSSPSGDYALCAFSMVQQTTKLISYQTGIEVPLFTFKNTEGECADGIVLLDNSDPEVVQAISSGFNFTQNITVLAARGNVCSGVMNNVADCESIGTGVTASPVVKDLIAYPVPAARVLNVAWTNPATYEKLNLEIFSNSGQLLKTIEVDATAGEKKNSIDLDGFAFGLYSFRLMNDKGEYQQYKFIVGK